MKGLLDQAVRVTIERRIGLDRKATLDAVLRETDVAPGDFVRNVRQLIDLMRDLNQRLGLTFIFSTHDQRLLEHTPRIVRLTDGRIESDSFREGDSHGQVLAACVS